jgi:tripartite-type tricarboxylate transporter receptor subunit TctC
MLRKLAAVLLVLFGLIGLTAPSRAEGWPTRPIRLVVPFPPGGGTDLSARIVAEYLGQKLGQSVVVENKAGAGSQIGIDVVAKSKPDGYTFGWASSDGLSIIPALKSSMTYKVPDDFEFIATGVKTSPLISINPKLPFKDIGELIAYGKANPGKLRYSTLGVGSSGHLAATLFSKTVGIEMTHIPYTGSAPAILAAVQGTVEFVIAGMGSVKSNLDSGALRALATTDSDRNLFYNQVPTLRESGVPISVILYIGLIAPAGTPQAVLDRLGQEMAAMKSDATVQERMKKIGSEFAVLPAKEFRSTVTDDLVRWRDVAKSANISIAR